MRLRIKGVIGSLCALLLTISTGACAPVSSRGAETGGPTLSMGLVLDAPGVGLEHEHLYSGFDVDVARYVAKELGYSEKQIVFKNIDPGQRIAALNRNSVDMVVVSLQESEVAAVQDEAQKEQADFEFAGPILTVWQDFLVSSAQKAELGGERGLDNKRVCTVKGTGDDTQVKQAVDNPQVLQYATYAQCLTSLMASQVDAVSADSAILHGYASHSDSDPQSVLGRKVSTIEHGVLTKAGTKRLSHRISGILATMVSDGTWSQSVQNMRKTTGYDVDTRLNPPHVRQ